MLLYVHLNMHYVTILSVLCEQNIIRSYFNFRKITSRVSATQEITPYASYIEYVHASAIGLYTFNIRTDVECVCHHSTHQYFDI
jgi:hypothetical protein